ncbi:MAG TPA: ATP-binding protein [Pirellulales bacterium]|nr:ATP-binding protein [Pirellulales bacterium]
MWKKVVGPTVLVSLLWVVVSCGSWYMLNRFDEAQTSVLYQSRNVIQAAGDMEENLWRLQAALLESADYLQREATLHERLEFEARRVEQAFEKALHRAGENISTPEERTLVEATREKFAAYQSFADGQLARGTQSSDEASRSVEVATRLARDVAKPCEELSELAQRLTDEAFQRRDRLRTRVNVTRISFVILGPAVGILLGLWVARGLHHTISEISVTLRGASGDLEQQIGLVEVSSGELKGLPALQQQVQAVSARIKQVVEELQRARREAVRSERLAAVGELAAGVAHELRNPLTSVKLLIQAVQRNQVAASADEKRLQVVEQEIVRMETTIRELLDFARPPKLRRVCHDVRDTLRRALTLVAASAQQAKVVIEEQLGDAPALVDADPAQLDQVFVNLLLNAIEAMADGGTLHVTVDQQGRQSDGLLRIVFRDTGSGIPDQVMSRLFEPFVTSKERGIGLGLAISRRIMQEHGGGLTASNAPPGGAMFIVEVPLAEPAARPVPSGNGSAPSIPETLRAQAIEAARH